MFRYRMFGGLVCGLFVFLSSTGWSCSDDRGTGLVKSGTGYSRGSTGGYRTYHK
ncbi:hypothetical protein [Oligoflexus tunisiensis]|uniref:hypothetical protein n=1 Tax=Oligoflexus tunisiensis TaxID=708132 RepID=UPI00159F12B8|nr:hypothetical protein [Oligoflexus tunisiensis]